MSKPFIELTMQDGLRMAIRWDQIRLMEEVKKPLAPVRTGIFLLNEPLRGYGVSETYDEVLRLIDEARGAQA